VTRAYPEPVDNLSKSPQSLRDRAEARWRASHRELSATSPEEAARLVHELEVHQIELQLQNEELRGSQQELETSLQRFSDLYDFAPVGYLTIDQNTVIVQANLTLAAMLGVERGLLVGHRFTRFLQRESADAFYLAQRAPDAPSWRGELILRKANGDELLVSIETVCVAGLWRCTVSDITERKRAEQAQRRGLEFETFLFDLSRTFIGLPEEEVDVHMARGLAQVGEFLEMDRVTLLELSLDRTQMTVAYSWSAPGVASPPSVFTQRTLPWWLEHVLRGDVSPVSHVDDLPEEAAAEKAYLRRERIASAATIPLRVGGEIAGAIAFVTVRRQVSWTEELVNQLRAVGDILWNALKRRQAMQAVLAAQGVAREGEERFRLAMISVASGVYTLDLNGMVTYVNPAAEAMFGWTSAELLGKQMHDVTHYKHPDGTPFPASDCPVIRVLQSGIELSEYADTFIRKDGTLFPVVLSSSPLKKDGAIVGIVVGFRDDTLRREAERALRETEALRASEDRYRGLAEQVVDGIFITDPSGRPVDANKAGCDLFGYTLDELKTLRSENALAVEEFPMLPEQLLANGEIVRHEWRFRRKDGSVFTGEVISRGLPDGRVQAVVRDITERKEAEAIHEKLHQLAMLPLSRATIEAVMAGIVEVAIAVRLALTSAISSSWTLGLPPCASWPSEGSPSGGSRRSTPRDMV
jgi:PAS domain S-box-containing protein